MKPTFLWLAVLALVGTPAVIHAQDLWHAQDRAEGSGTLNLVFAVPQGDFADNVDRNGVGATVFFGGRLPHSPLILGTEVGLVNYGRDERLQLYDLANVPVEVVDFATSSNIVMGHLVARLQPPTGIIQPYAEAVAGVNYFVTRTHIGSGIIIDDGFSASANMSDWAFTYGGGAGLDLTLYTGPMGFDDEPGSVALSIGARYLFGTDASYVNRSSVQQIDGRFLFDTTRSGTDMIMPQLGLRV
ncbi:MAG TPA: hypothetical protein VFG50_14915, partial [Rhodothermales bacterium]|nr:hypothetical protein [Rhodothermales bacterium]